MPSDGRLRVLVVDDEPLGRLRIEDLLRANKRAKIVGTAADGNTAIRAIRSLKPDLVFLDVQMPGKTGIDVVREIGSEAMPATIFVTAYDRYAIQAFDVAAVDYLVKPFDDERFEQAFGRARRLLGLQGIDRVRRQLVSLLVGEGAEQDTAGSTPRGSDQYLQRIAVESNGKVHPVEVSDIEYIVARGPYARLFVKDHRYLIRERMQELETQLDPTQFLRIHRSIIVRLELVEAMRRDRRGEPEVQLKNGVRLKVSRSRRESLESWLGVLRSPT